MSATIFSVGLDVHKDSVTIAVFRNRDAEPVRVDRLPNDDKKLRRYFERLGAEGSVRACYEASGAGYVLQRALASWGIPCELAAPSLMPTRPGEHRKTDRRDAIKIAQDFRDGRLVLIHIPTEEDERVRDLVRCRETFQREIIKSRHYILKFLRRRGFIYRDGTHWTVRHMNWIRQALGPDVLSEEDHAVLAEYFALLEYKLGRRDELDRKIEALALTPRYKPVVDRLVCFRGWRALFGRTKAAWRHHQSRQRARASRAHSGRVVLPPATNDRRTAPAPSGGPGSSRARPRLEMPAPPLQSLPPTRGQEAQTGRSHGRRPRDGRLPVGYARRTRHRGPPALGGPSRSLNNRRCFTSRRGVPGAR